MPDIIALIEGFFQAAFGWLLLTGLVLFVSERRPPTPEAILKERAKKLEDRNQRLTGHAKSLQDANAYLEATLKRAHARLEKSQQSEEKLRAQVGRLEKEVRSREFALMEERSRPRSRR